MNHDFQVIVNKIVGEEAENDTRCDICLRLGTVVILGKVMVCKVCLMVADVAISRELCPPCAVGGNDVPSKP
jgi:hypothetical protein